MRKLGLALGLGLAGVVYAGDVLVKSVIDRTFQREVVDYGDAVVLFYGSAPSTEEKIVENDNNRRAFYKIAKMSKEIDRNGHPIKFVTYDIQQHVYQGMSGEEASELLNEQFEVVGIPSLHFYRDGELFDTMPCGLRDEGAVVATINNIGKGLIPSVYEGPLDGKIYGYEGTCRLHELK